MVATALGVGRLEALLSTLSFIATLPSREKSTLEATLAKLGVEELLICGMMTQNCVTHTAISKSAKKYRVAILSDCCTTVNEMLHLIALHAVSTRVRLAESGAVL